MQILLFILFAVALLLIYNTLKAFVLCKLKISRLKILIYGTILFFLVSVISVLLSGKNFNIISTIPGVIVVLFTFMWIIDLTFDLMPGKKKLKDEKSNFKPKPKGKPSKKKD